MSEANGGAPVLVDAKAVALTGLALDWATGVADGRGLRIDIEADQPVIRCVESGVRWAPTSDWNQCGELLERHGIHVERGLPDSDPDAPGLWAAYVYDEDGITTVESGEVSSARTAICLAVVFASMEGAEFVDDFELATIKLPQLFVTKEMQPGRRNDTENQIEQQILAPFTGAGRPAAPTPRAAEDQERDVGGIGHYLGRVNTYANELRAALVQVNEVLRENGLEPVVIPHMK